jgi:hypothetical protein
VDWIDMAQDRDQWRALVNSNSDIRITEISQCLAFAAFGRRLVQISARISFTLTNITYDCLSFSM